MKLSGKIETVANVATATAAVLLSVALVKQSLVHPNRAGAPSTARVAKGSNVKSSLPGVDWASNGGTLILAISTGCHFCTESGPFFRRIQNESGKAVKLLAVLPQPTADARQYLDDLGVHVDDVRQAPLDSLGIAATPTLLLVNGAGTVTDVWEGVLSKDQEDSVLAAARNPPSERK
jgi:hypothetical protein